MKNPIKKITAWAIVFTLSFSQNTLPSLYAAKASPESLNSRTQILTNLTTVQVPKNLGHIQDIFHGKEGAPIFLIQDAHEIPEAQRNIEKLIEYLSAEYGVRSVKLEGASSKLDSQIFQSFPNQKRLREVFEAYYDRGELTGGTGAAIFRQGAGSKEQGVNSHAPSPMHHAEFSGMEDWPLYEAGLGFYQEAMGKEEELQKAVSSMQEALREEKKSAYPKSLLVIDEGLEAFHENHANLKDVLFLLSKIREPEKGTQLQVLLEEMQEEGKSRPAIVIEVRKLAKEAERALRLVHSRQSTVGRKNKDLVTVDHGPSTMDLQEFHAKLQQFNTSEITPQAFALYMKQRFSMKVSDQLLKRVSHEETLNQIEGTELFRELEIYIKDVKESLFENAGQRELDRQTHQLQLLTKLVKLELTREEWEEVKAVSSMQKAVSSFHFSAFQDHLAFYRNAESREKAFSLLLSADGLLPTVIVAGGFHTQGLAAKLKAQGISYAIITPKMTTIPEQTNYREHMKGNVSWKNYFEVKDGKVNLYDAFVRATRDQLLKLDVRSSKLEEIDGDQLVQLPTSNFQLAKLWRDQIIRDLAAKNELTHAHEYTRFIDELSIEQSADLPAEAKRQAGSKGSENSMPYALSTMLRQAEQFVAGLKLLHSRNQLTEQNILNLLKPSTTPTMVNAELLVPRSELRNPSLIKMLILAIAVVSSSAAVPQKSATLPIPQSLLKTNLPAAVKPESVTPAVQQAPFKVPSVFQDTYVWKAKPSSSNRYQRSPESDFYAQWIFHDPEMLNRFRRFEDALQAAWGKSPPQDLDPYILESPLQYRLSLETLRQLVPRAFTILENRARFSVSEEDQKALIDGTKIVKIYGEGPLEIGGRFVIVIRSDAEFSGLKGLLLAACADIIDQYSLPSETALGNVLWDAPAGNFFHWVRNLWKGSYPFAHEYLRALKVVPQNGAILAERLEDNLFQPHFTLLKVGMFVFAWAFLVPIFYGIWFYWYNISGFIFQLFHRSPKPSLGVTPVVRKGGGFIHLVPNIRHRHPKSTRRSEVRLSVAVANP
ncbi:MAG: hypothetical protein EXS63_03425, partial [Candidatus Omnitrophica bacterium]|nr:hypothetical protein [Candidatus Omnitrophota bacterium]